MRERRSGASHDEPRAPRIVFRLVTGPDPPLRDFLSLAELGHPPYDDPVLQWRAEEVSVWDKLAAALDLARRKRSHRYVAILEIPEGVELRPGKRGHYGIPKGIAAAQIKKWIVDVLDVT